MVTDYIKPKIDATPHKEKAPDSVSQEIPQHNDIVPDKATAPKELPNVSVQEPPASAQQNVSSEEYLQTIKQPLRASVPTAVESMNIQPPKTLGNEQKQYTMGELERIARQTRAENSLTPEEQKQLERRHKASRTLAMIGDGVQGIANLFGTIGGARSQKLAHSTAADDNAYLAYLRERRRRDDMYDAGIDRARMQDYSNNLRMILNERNNAAAAQRAAIRAQGDADKMNANHGFIAEENQKKREFAVKQAKVKTVRTSGGRRYRGYSGGGSGRATSSDKGQNSIALYVRQGGSGAPTVKSFNYSKSKVGGMMSLFDEIRDRMSDSINRRGYNAATKQMLIAKMDAIKSMTDPASAENAMKAFIEKNLYKYPDLTYHAADILGIDLGEYAPG